MACGLDGAGRSFLGQTQLLDLACLTFGDRVKKRLLAFRMNGICGWERCGTFKDKKGRVVGLLNAYVCLSLPVRKWRVELCMRLIVVTAKRA